MTDICDRLTEAEQEAIGKELVKIFRMRRSENKGRYQMTWGDKTPLGVFRTFVRIADDINARIPIKA
jgi:hypothetical protein